MRTEFLLKLELGAPAAELARAQLDGVRPGVRRAAATRPTPIPTDVVARWRLESAEATRRFLRVAATVSQLVST